MLQKKVTLQNGKGLTLSWMQRIVLRANGYVFLRYEQRRGWTSQFPIFLVKCKKHGYFEGRRYGYKEYFLCPRCHAEEEMGN